MLYSLTLRDLLDRGVAVHASEAVALVNRLMHDDTSASGATGPYGPLALDNVEITHDGDVRCTATAATPSVYEAAALLHELLASSSAPIPGALRYTISRGLLEVDAPPFDSLQQFGAALERFQDGAAADVIAALHARALSVRTERRRARAAHDALRRELREADLRLYAATSSLDQPVRQRQTVGNARPIVGCMLAGAALVVAGGVNSVVRHTAPAELAPTRVERRVETADIVLPAERVALADPDVIVRTPPRFTARPAKAAVRPAASMQPHRVTRAAPARQRQASDPDRGVIARIRFEWTNPFR